MKLNSSKYFKLLLFVVALVGLGLTFDLKKALANAETVQGHVMYRRADGNSAYDIPASQIVAHWTDGYGSVRNMNTAANGTFSFPSWQLMSDNDRAFECSNPMILDLTGNARQMQAVRAGGRGGCASADGAYGCREDNQTVSMWQPKGWTAGFWVPPTVGRNPNGSMMSSPANYTINNIILENQDNGTVDIGTFHYVIQPPRGTMNVSTNQIILGQAVRLEDAITTDTPQIGTLGITYLVRVDGNNNVQPWSESCPGPVYWGIYCRYSDTDRNNFTPATSNPTDWTPQNPGNYIAYVDAQDSLGQKCSGNPTSGLGPGYVHCNGDTTKEWKAINVIALSPTPSISANSQCGATSDTISWANTSSTVQYVDISTDPGFGNYSNKYVAGSTSTQAPSGFSGGLTLNLGTKYYVRTWNGQTHSNVVSFTTPSTFNYCPPPQAATQVKISCANVSDDGSDIHVSWPDIGVPINAVVVSPDQNFSRQYYRVISPAANSGNIPLDGAGASGGLTLPPSYYTNTTYYVKLQSPNNNVNTSPTAAATFNIPQCPAPSVQKLTVQPDTTSGAISGPQSVSGLRSNQGGTNVQNGLHIEPNLQSNFTNTDNISLSGAAFTDQVVNTNVSGTSPFTNLLTSIGPKGYLFVYVNQVAGNTNGFYYNPSYPSLGVFTASSNNGAAIGAQHFLPNNYYVYTNGTWYQPLPVGRFATQVQGALPSGLTQLVPVAGTINPNAALNPAWNITLDKSIGSHQWHTYGFVLGPAGSDVSSATNPSSNQDSVAGQSFLQNVLQLFGF